MLGTVLSLKSSGSNMLLPKLSRTQRWAGTTSSRKSSLEELTDEAEAAGQLVLTGVAD